MKHLENDKLDDFRREFITGSSVMLELLIQSSHGGKFKHDRKRINANSDKRNDVRMFQVDENVQFLSEKIRINDRKSNKII